MTMALNVDEMKTLPELASLPASIQKLIRRTARQVVLANDEVSRGSLLEAFRQKVRDFYILNPTSLHGISLCNAPALRREAVTRSYALMMLVLREAGEIDERMLKAGAA